MSQYESDLFERSAPVVLANEGGYVNDPDDAGGETNFGVTHGTLRRAVNEGIVDASVDSVTKLSPEIARKIYAEMYFLPSGAGKLNWPLSLLQFDCAVNCGVSGAVKLFQRALNSLGGHLVVDGAFGPKTMQEFLHQWVHAGAVKIGLAMCDERLAFYDRLVKRKPKQAKFLKGWRRRVERNRAEAGLS